MRIGFDGGGSGRYHRQPESSNNDYNNTSRVEAPDEVFANNAFNRNEERADPETLDALAETPEEIVEVPRIIMVEEVPEVIRGSAEDPIQRAMRELEIAYGQETAQEKPKQPNIFKHDHRFNNF